MSSLSDGGSTDGSSYESKFEGEHDGAGEVDNNVNQAITNSAYGDKEEDNDKLIVITGYDDSVRPNRRPLLSKILWQSKQMKGRVLETSHGPWLSF